MDVYLPAFIGVVVAGLIVCLVILYAKFFEGDE